MKSQEGIVWEEWLEYRIIYSLFHYIKEQRKYQVGWNHGLGCGGNRAWQILHQVIGNNKRSITSTCNPPIRGKDRIRAIYRSKDPASIQVSPYGGPLTTDIFVERIYGKGSGISVNCSWLNSMLGIGRKWTSYNCFLSSCFLTGIGGDLRKSKIVIGRI